MEIADLTAEQAETIHALTGVDVMAPPDVVTFARRYAALAFFRRREAGETSLTFAEVMRQPLTRTVDEMKDPAAVDPTAAPANRAARRAGAAKAAPAAKSRR